MRRPSLRSSLTIITISIACFAMGASGARAQITAFENVTVLTMDEKRVLAGHTVIVEGRRIAAIGPSDQLEVPDGTVVIDGSDKFLMPGLAEMHGHLPSASREAESIDHEMFLYIANGITTVRGMLGNSTHLRLRDEIARGERLGPRLFAAGPSLNGNSVRSKQQAWSSVTEQKASGYDLLKIHPGLSRELFDEIVKTAASENISYGGHIPVDVGLDHALASGIATIEHIDGYVEALVPESSPVPAAQTAFFGANLVDHVDEARLAALVAKTKESGAWVVPTQCLMENILGSNATRTAQRAEMKYATAVQISNWTTQATNAQQGLTTSEGSLRRFLALRGRIIDALHEAGVGVLLGADSPQIFNIPGFATLQELDLLVAAGLSPYEALETGTINPARYFGLEGSFGTVSVGKRADLVLLEANPLEEISNVRKTAGVMVTGRWLSKKEIDEGLAVVAKAMKAE